MLVSMTVMNTYVFHLQTFNRRKRIEFKASNLDNALAYVKKNFPNWDISMFWPKWPTPL